MNERLIVPIVEGHGEVAAVPALLHRLHVETGNRGQLRVNPPIRVKASAFLRPGHADFARYLALARAKSGRRGLVLLLFDCDDGCPAEQGPALLDRARASCPDVPLLVALAYREFETWFVAAARSLSEAGFLTGTRTPPPAPESIRDAKGWLGQRMEGGYDPVRHQLDMARAFDFDAARRVASFDRFCRRIVTYLEGAGT